MGMRKKGRGMGGGTGQFQRALAKVVKNPPLSPTHLLEGIADKSLDKLTFLVRDSGAFRSFLPLFSRRRKYVNKNFNLSPGIKSGKVLGRQPFAFPIVSSQGYFHIFPFYIHCVLQHAQNAFVGIAIVRALNDLYSQKNI